MNKPVLVLFVTGASLILSFTQYSFAEGKHEHSHGEKHWAAPKAEAAKANPIKSNPTSIQRGSKSYDQLCASCHGTKALGDGIVAATLEPKPTNLKAMSGRHSDGDFAWKIANGRGAMPAWNTALDENQIWDLVNFIQNLKNTDDHDDETHGHDEHKKKHTH